MYLIGDIEEIETIAVGGRIKDIMCGFANSMGLADGANSKAWRMFVFRVEGYVKQRSTGTKPTALVERR